MTLANTSLSKLIHSHGANAFMRMYCLMPLPPPSMKTGRENIGSSQKYLTRWSNQRPLESMLLINVVDQCRSCECDTHTHLFNKQIDGRISAPLSLPLSPLLLSDTHTQANLSKLSCAIDKLWYEKKKQKNQQNLKKTLNETPTHNRCSLCVAAKEKTKPKMGEARIWFVKICFDLRRRYLLPNCNQKLFDEPYWIERNEMNSNKQWYSIMWELQSNIAWVCVEINCQKRTENQKSNETDWVPNAQLQMKRTRERERESGKIWMNATNEICAVLQWTAIAPAPKSAQGISSNKKSKKMKQIKFKKTKRLDDNNEWFEEKNRQNFSWRYMNVVHIKSNAVHWKQNTFAVVAFDFRAEF